MKFSHVFAFGASFAVLYACSNDTEPKPPAGGETCDSYCKRMSTTCNEPGNNPFPGPDPMATCLKTCTNWPAGDLKSANDDLGCRARILSSTLELSGAEKAAGCQNAGPISAGCGGVCATFCHLNTSVCIGSTAQYASVSECMTQCNTFPQGLDRAIPQTKDGNSVACRAYHTLVATGSEVDRATHCPHAGNPASAHCFGTLDDAGTVSDASSD